MNGIDETILQVERLYQGITGRPLPQTDSPYAPIPAEKDPSRQVEESMERLMGLLGRPLPTSPPFSPLLTAQESPAELLICLDLPGTRREQVEVAIQGNLLVVTGVRQSPVCNGHQLRLSEVPLGRFHRVIPLPQGTRPAGMTAQLRDGVLEIRIPRETPQPQRGETIPVT